MVDFPEPLIHALQSGDCILWAGAGIGALAGRPTWSDLLGRLVESTDLPASGELADLLEQGRLRPVLGHVWRHAGDEPLAKLLTEASAGELKIEAGEALGQFSWRAAFATLYSDVMYGLFERAGKKVDVLNPVDLHELSLRDRSEPFILRTPPTGRTMRADRAFFDLVEELVRTRTILFLGFDIDDPDLYQILALIDRVGRGKQHYAALPFVSTAEAEELSDQYGITVVDIEAGDEGVGTEQLGAFIDALAAAQESTPPQPTSSDGDLAALDLGRALSGLDVRLDYALDSAALLEPDRIDALIEALPDRRLTASLPSKTLLQAGNAMFGFGRLDEAQRCFQDVIRLGTGREWEATARFNLAWVALAQGDGDAAVTGLNQAAESTRTLSLVPPRYQITGARSVEGARVRLEVLDRATQATYEAVVTVLHRPSTPGERGTFLAGVKRLAEIEHPSLAKVVDGFAFGRVFGVLQEPIAGFVLAQTIVGQGQAIPLSRAFEIVGPVLEVLERLEARAVVHGNISMASIVLAQDGAQLRDVSVVPLWPHRRPSMRAWLGEVAPEVEAGDAPSPASDMYGVGGLLYRCVTGRAPSGRVPALREWVEDADPRLDALLAALLHPEPRKRPKPGTVRTEIATILTTPVPAPTASPPAPAAAAPSSATPTTPAPAAPASAPAKGPVGTPTDPDDLEAWTYFWEQNPTNMEAREGVDRIENQARAEGRWDRVAEVLNVRARLAQVQTERIELRRELAGVLESELGAPQNAFETLLSVLEEISLSAQVELVDDLERLASATGRWGEFADVTAQIALRTPESSDKVGLERRLATIYRTELSAPDKAIACLERALELDAEDLELHEAARELYRSTGRHADLAGDLLTVAELEEGKLKHEHLLEAARVLHEELGEDEGALDAVEIVRAEAPDNDEAIALTRVLAGAVERWSLLYDVLMIQADRSIDDDVAAGLYGEAAEVARQHTSGEQAIAAYTKLLERSERDVDSARALLELARPRVSKDPTLRKVMIDALEAIADATRDADDQRGWMTALAELATLLDQEPDGARMAAEYRSTIVNTLPPDAELAGAAAAKLEQHHRSEEAYDELLELLMARASSSALPVAERKTLWSKILDLRKVDGPLEDADAERMALEALAALEPQGGVNLELLDRYLQAGDEPRAREFIDKHLAQLGSDDSVEGKIKRAGLLRGRAGLALLEQSEEGRERALEAVEAALALGVDLSASYLMQRDVFEAAEQPIKAAEALVAAANHSASKVAKVRHLFDAGRTQVEVLGNVPRGIELLEQVVTLDPDHREATGLLLSQLVERDELERAWPIAQTYVMQTRAAFADRPREQIDALALAGRCALAVNEMESAREYLSAAKKLDATNFKVVRLLADLDLTDGNFEAALKGYQAVVLSSASKMSSAEQAQLYTTMGRARLGMGERDKAKAMVRRALEIDRMYEPAARYQLELAEHGTPGEQAAALVDVAELLSRRIPNLEGEARTEVEEEEIEVRRRAATVYAESLNRPDEASRQLDRVLALRPTKQSVLHEVLELHTAAGEWRSATEVLEKLGELQAIDSAKAKFLYAGAVILRDQVGDREGAMGWMRRVLEAEPRHEKAFQSLVDTYSASGEWKQVARILRERLKSLPEDAEPEDRVSLLEQIGDVYERHLGDPKTAIAAFEQAVMLAPGDEEADVLARRRTRVIELAISMGEDEIDRAIAQAQGLVGDRPGDFETYRQLIDLYQRAKRRDSAICVAKTLRFLKKATEEELALAAEGDGHEFVPRGALTRAIVRKDLAHGSENVRLSELFGLIWPVVALREGLAHESYGVARKDGKKITLESKGVAGAVARVCKVTDTALPDFFETTKPGGFVVGAPAVDNVVTPTLLAGKAAISAEGAALWFRVGRAVSKLRGEHLLASVLHSGASLRHAIYGSVLACRPDIAVPEESREPAEAYAERFKRLLPPARMDNLKTQVSKVVESGGADTKAWLSGVEYTATRLGFVLSDSLEVAVRVLNSATGEGSRVEPQLLVKDLITYSVTEHYFKVRNAFKISYG